jgi:hypothetical protein
LLNGEMGNCSIRSAKHRCSWNAGGRRQYATTASCVGQLATHPGDDPLRAPAAIGIAYWASGPQPGAAPHISATL